MMKRQGVTYELHHIGIQTDQPMHAEQYSASARMYTSDDLGGPVPIQWHRLEADSPLPEMVRTTLPHTAYKVNDLTPAIAGHEGIIGPYEPVDGYYVAVTDNGGVPVQLMQTTLSDAEIRGSASRH